MEHILLTGPPGVGKTTAARRLADKWHSLGHQVLGFYTEEVRINGKRIGFDIVGFDGQRTELARIAQEAQFASNARVGQYAVNIASVDAAVANYLHPALNLSPSNRSTLLIIDEIGKMELFSELFAKACNQCSEQISSSSCNYRLVATVPINWRHTVINRLCNNKQQCQLLTVSRDNRQDLPDLLLQQLSQSSFKDYS